MRPLEDGDVAALLPLFHGTQTELRANLYDAGRAGGRNVVVIEGRGLAGWVDATPCAFGAPVLAADADTAAALIAHLIARARAIGAERLRISAAPSEDAKRAALEAAGFTPELAFITVARSLGEGDGAPWSGPWTRVPFEALDHDRLADVMNATFDGIPNSTAMSAADLRDDLARPLTSRAATAAWDDGTADYAGFTHVTLDGAVATVEAIGVRAAHRGGGHARRMLDDALAQVRGTCTEARALIASTNAPSLGLFRARGFTEIARRTVYEITLA